MGFYLRKGLNFGPLRLNLSRSGLGVSLGVRGARVGVGPRGAYVHAGRGGLYYRQSIPISRAAVPKIDPNAASAPSVENTALSQFTSLPPDKLVQDLTRVRQRRELFPIALFCSAIAVGYFLLVPFGWYPWWRLVLVIVLPILLYTRHLDVMRGTLVLHLDLSGDLGTAYHAFVECFRRFASCDVVWHLEKVETTDAWKTHAGVTRLVSRSQTRASLSTPPKVVSNVLMPSLRAGTQTLYFFPDRLLAYHKFGILSVAYQDLEVETGESQFHEDGSVPRDTKIIGTTWLYVNKSGEPDRRFRNNREVPIVVYGVIGFGREPGLTAVFQCSNPAVAGPLAAGLKNLAVTRGEPAHNPTWRLVISRPTQRQESAVRALLGEFKPDLASGQIDAMLSGNEIEVAALSVEQANRLMARLDDIGVPSRKYQVS